MTIKTFVGKALMGLIIGFAACTSAYCNHDQLTCLADNVYFEARGESREGWSAVTNVVFNRMKSKHFPDTACQVVKQRRGNVCQFSWVCNKPVKSSKYRETKLYQDIHAFVHHMYKNRSNVVDNTNGALFYHSAKISISKLGLNKQCTKTTRIGNHIFYNVKSKDKNNARSKISQRSGTKSH